MAIARSVTMASDLRMTAFILACLLRGDIFTMITAAILMPVPRNLTVLSINMGAILEWTLPYNSGIDMTFTVMYRDVLSSAIVCNRTKERKCDLGRLSAFADYTFSVRSELCNNVSEWAETKFTLITHTTIGPPTVELVFVKDAIEVKIKDPDLKIRNLRELYSDVAYFIKYWKAGMEDMPAEPMKVDKTHVRIKTQSSVFHSRYCVRAQVYIQTYRKYGLLSESVCVSTGTVLVECLVAAGVALPLLLLVLWLSYRGKQFLDPDATLPQHLKQYLSEAPGWAVSLEIQFTKLPKEEFDQITAVCGDSPCEGLTRELEGEPNVGTGTNSEGRISYYNVFAANITPAY